MPKGGPAALGGADRMDIGRGEPLGTARKGRAQDQILAESRRLGRYERGHAQCTCRANDRDDTAINGRFKGENREVLEQMRQAERDAWSTVEHRHRRSRPRIARAAAMKDETVTLSRIVAHCVQSQFRYLENPAEVDPPHLATASPPRSSAGFARLASMWFRDDRARRAAAMARRQRPRRPTGIRGDYD
jgi:hypothetical protein